MVKSAHLAIAEKRILELAFAILFSEIEPEGFLGQRLPSLAANPQPGRLGKAGLMICRHVRQVNGALPIFPARKIVRVQVGQVSRVNDDVRAPAGAC